jgi:hypothetical protein
MTEAEVTTRINSRPGVGPVPDSLEASGPEFAVERQSCSRTTVSTPTTVHVGLCPLLRRAHPVYAGLPVAGHPPSGIQCFSSGRSLLTVGKTDMHRLTDRVPRLTAVPGAWWGFRRWT